MLSLLVVTLLLGICGYRLGKNLTKRPGKMQVMTEKGVMMLYNMVRDTMGAHNVSWTPYIGTIFLSSICGSFIGLTGFLRSSTADLSVPLTWGVMTSVIIWYQSIKRNGFVGWLKGFAEPVVVMTPMNIISEIAQPVSMAFRHFGNVAGGSVLTSLIYAALALVSNLVLGWLPWLLGNIPFFQTGIPAFLSLYFDLFSGFVQAFVFSLLTMIYIAGANPPPEELPAKGAAEESKTA
jgi:F-type H+-transporting ATPase subunit a